jgi:hypothetical protein
MNRLANYAKHARVTHAIYGITSYHDYRIVNAIQQLLNFKHHIVSCSTLEIKKQASPMSEGVVEIGISSHLARANNRTTRQT